MLQIIGETTPQIQEVLVDYRWPLNVWTPILGEKRILRSRLLAETLRTQVLEEL